MDAALRFVGDEGSVVDLVNTATTRMDEAIEAASGVAELSSHQGFLSSDGLKNELSALSPGSEPDKETRYSIFANQLDIVATAIEGLASAYNDAALSAGPVLLADAIAIRDQARDVRTAASLVSQQAGQGSTAAAPPSPSTPSQASLGLPPTTIVLASLHRLVADSTKRVIAVDAPTQAPGTGVAECLNLDALYDPPVQHNSADLLTLSLDASSGDAVPVLTVIPTTFPAHLQLEAFGPSDKILRVIEQPPNVAADPTNTGVALGVGDVLLWKASGSVAGATSALSEPLVLSDTVRVIKSSDLFATGVTELQFYVLHPCQGCRFFTCACDALVEAGTTYANAFRSSLSSYRMLQQDRANAVLAADKPILLLGQGAALDAFLNTFLHMGTSVEELNITKTFRSCRCEVSAKERSAAGVANATSAGSANRPLTVKFIRSRTWPTTAINAGTAAEKNQKRAEFLEKCALELGVHAPEGIAAIVVLEPSTPKPLRQSETTNLLLQLANLMKVPFPEVAKVTYFAFHVASASNNSEPNLAASYHAKAGDSVSIVEDGLVKTVKSASKDGVIVCEEDGTEYYPGEYKKYSPNLDSGVELSNWPTVLQSKFFATPGEILKANWSEWELEAAADNSFGGLPPPQISLFLNRLRKLAQRLPLWRDNRRILSPSDALAHSEHIFNRVLYPNAAFFLGSNTQGTGGGKGAGKPFVAASCRTSAGIDINLQQQALNTNAASKSLTVGWQSSESIEDSFTSATLVSLGRLAINGVKITNATFHCPSLGNLQELMIEDCSLYGTPLQELMEWCTSLTSLGLIRCAGSIPLQHISQLKYLTTFDLNHSTGLCDSDLEHLKEMRQLETLRLNGCTQITDKGLSHLVELRQLKVFELADCSKITDAGLAHMSEMRQIRQLNLSRCAQVGEAGLKHIAELRNMEDLKLTSCTNISDGALFHLSQMIKMVKLDLSGCFAVGDGGLLHLSKMIHMKHFNLSGCYRLTDRGIQHITEFRELVTLQLTGCWLLGDGALQAMYLMHLLQRLDLSDCYGVTDAGLQHLKDLRQMRTLSFSGCSALTDAGLKHLVAMRETMSLDLSRCCEITEAGIMVLGNSMKNLQVLNYNDCTANDAVVGAMKVFSRLHTLTIAGNYSVTDQGIAELLSTGLADITTLDVSRCPLLTDRTAETLAVASRMTKLTMNGCTKITDGGVLWIKRLTALRFLDLCGADGITSAGARDLATLTELATMDVSGSQIADDGIEQFKKMRNLLHLKLSGCPNVTSLSLEYLSQMRQLKTLDLSSCPKVTDAGLQHIGELRRLVKLNISNCFLTDAGLLHLREMRQLEALTASGCSNFSDVGLAYLANMLELEQLDLSGCPKLTEAGLVHLKGMKKMKKLSFAGCGNLNDAAIQHLAALKELQSLSLAGVKITDASFAFISSCKNLTELDITSCTAVTDTGLQQLASVKLLEELSLTGCTGVTDKGLLALSGLLHITSFSVANVNKVTDAGLAALADMRKVKSLNLGGCSSVTDAGLQNVRQMRVLESLNLTQLAKVTDTGVQHFSAMKQLKSLSLNGLKELTDIGMQLMNGFRLLLSLDLGGCVKVSDAGFGNMKEMRHMQALTLAGCAKMTDAALKHLAKMPEIVRLDLSGFPLSDAGAPSLAHLRKLQSLNLSSCVKITDSALTHLEAMPDLNTLHIGGCSSMGDGGLSHLKALRNLRTLLAYNCPKITDHGLQHLALLSKLQTLHLASCTALTDVGLSHLKPLTNLTTMSLLNCNLLTDNGLQHLRVLIQMKELQLTNCTKITDQGIAYFKDMQQLQSLSISNCPAITPLGKKVLKDACPALNYS